MTRVTSKVEAKPSLGGAMIAAMRRFFANGTWSADFATVTFLRDTANYSVRANPLCIQEIPHA